MKKIFRTDLVLAIAAGTLLNACQTTGDNLRADVYDAQQVNKQQEVKTVELIAVKRLK